jgi:2-polyprenyl-3-methyl-5-hydroxy-6-metoxy-1,4-benzoquinol methylase
MDPIGKAILEYSKFKKPADIIVSSDICEDDIIPIELLFRTFDEMPEIEKIALNECKGKILDVGAGAGSHVKHLQNKGFKVLAIEISQGAVDYMISQHIDAKKINFFDYNNEKFDTILLLMNGIGIAGKLSNLENTLNHAKSLLNPGGQILCDSSDIKYLYEDEDGSIWTDLNSEYYGNFRFQMKYKKEVGAWFDWLYVDFENLFQIASKVGLKTLRLIEKENHYLAKLTN